LTEKNKTLLKRGGIILAVFVLYCALFGAIVNQSENAPLIFILAVAATTVTTFVAFRLARKFNL